MKECRDCGDDLVVGDNWTEHRKKTYMYRCTQCNKKYSKDTARNSWLYSTYGIRERDYDALLKSQGGGCAICGKTEEPSGKQLAVDHDHEKDYMDIRGILCSDCNKGIGCFNDNTDMLKNAIRYLGD